jgi:hypothetical protein
METFPDNIQQIFLDLLRTLRENSRNKKFILFKIDISEISKFIEIYTIDDISFFQFVSLFSNLKSKDDKLCLNIFTNTFTSANFNNWEFMNLLRKLKNNIPSDMMDPVLLNLNLELSNSIQIFSKFSRKFHPSNILKIQVLFLVTFKI